MGMKIPPPVIRPMGTRIPLPVILSGSEESASSVVHGKSGFLVAALLGMTGLADFRRWVIFEGV
jgi:hypothetical protein